MIKMRKRMILTIGSLIFILIIALLSVAYEFNQTEIDEIIGTDDFTGFTYDEEKDAYIEISETQIIKYLYNKGRIQKDRIDELNETVQTLKSQSLSLRQELCDKVPSINWSWNC